jgi:hypothetical protein
MLLVQKYLETHTFGDLVRDHGVYASFSKSGHKFSLNYDQIEAKEADPLAQECRGLVLAAEDGKSFTSQAQQVNGRNNYDHISPGKTVILAYPMNRFFNYGQGTAAVIDWSDPKLSVLEKLDGTLCIVYYDPFTDKWCVATRSVSEADLLMDNGLFTFRTLFEKALTETTGYAFDVFTRYLDKAYTYCFELTTPYNRIVVEYKNNGVTLLAVRGLVTLKEVDFKHPVVDLLPTCLPLVQAYTFTTVEKTLEWVSSLNPMEHEGVVVKQGESRIKVKNPAYVAYNKVRDALATSPRNMVELILTEKDDDVIPMLPEEIVKNLQEIKVGVQRIIKQHDEGYLAIKAEADSLKPGDKKTFAVLTTVTYKSLNLWTAPFFQMFDGKASNMKDFIMKSRGKDGSWGNNFLDKMLELAKSQ